MPWRLLCLFTTHSKCESYTLYVSVYHMHLKNNTCENDINVPLSLHNNPWLITVVFRSVVHAVCYWSKLLCSVQYKTSQKSTVHMVNSSAALWLSYCFCDFYGLRFKEEIWYCGSHLSWQQRRGALLPKDNDLKICWWKFCGRVGLLNTSTFSTKRSCALVQPNRQTAWLCCNLCLANAP